MKSIRYQIFRKKPHNLDDCLDFSVKKQPLEVSVELSVDEYVSEMYILKHLIGAYTWKFSDHNVKIEKIYNAFFYDKSEKNQMLSIDQANKRLEEDIQRMKRLNINLKDEGKKFDYSIIYRHTQNGN
ncbi:MAG: hypothetical protein Q8O03_04395 [Nanoarchaeota archaeon]|nr:hypothetical protein [Nanoarchaeota archaeon]